MWKSVRFYSRRLSVFDVLLICLWVLLTLLFSVRVALAGTTELVPVSITPIWSTATPYITAISSALVIWLIKIGNAWLVAHKLSIAQDDFDQALNHVPALMANELASLAAHNPTVSVPVALSNVASLVAQMAPNAALLKFTPAQVQAMVSAKLTGAKPASA